MELQKNYLERNQAYKQNMSKNMNETTRQLKFRYISIFTNLLRTDNETKSEKTIYNQIN